MPARNYLYIAFLTLLGLALIICCLAAMVIFAIGALGFASGAFLMFAAIAAAGLIGSLVFSARVLWPMIRYYAKIGNARP
jgi:hypothetical protein